MAIKIDIGADFSDVPAGRFPADGPFNGEHFRKNFLVPALNSGKVVEINLDNTEGYGSSFLEEAFGGLVRREGYKKSTLDENLKIVATRPKTIRYKRLIESYISNASEEPRDA